MGGGDDRAPEADAVAVVTEGQPVQGAVGAVGAQAPARGEATAEVAGRQGVDQVERAGVLPEGDEVTGEVVGAEPARGG